MKQLFKYILFVLSFIFVVQMLYSQQGSMVATGNVKSEDGEALLAVTIVEMDNTNRVVGSAITDVNGEFSLKIKSPHNKLRITYIGYKSQVVAIGDKRVFHIVMTDDNLITEVVVKAKKEVKAGGFTIPERENGAALQKINTKEFEGLSVASIDDALQGRIAGLDIIANSGDVGSGTQMRMRGVTSINGSTTPLIVLNGIIFETESSSGFDFSSANDEKYAELLSVSPDDIESITVLKDAASTAIWGSKGANGVIEITTKRGARGKTAVQYSYRLSGAWQPEGMKLLTGDQYTMLMKEEYFNPKQSNTTSNIEEFNYDKSWSEYYNFNKNTDWVKEVSQFGWTHDHNLSVSGGGEKALYRISGNYYNQTGIVLKQKLDRFSTRMNLDYAVSDRIKFMSEFSFTYTDQDKNYDRLLEIAYKKMPNLSVYKYDEYGNNTGEYYSMLQSTSSQLSDQKGLRNPVASANLANNNLKSYRIIPTFRLQYDMFDPDKTYLRYEGMISFDVQNNSTYSFLPKELSTNSWSDASINSSTNAEDRSMEITMQHDLTWRPKFSNPDHSLSANARFSISSSNARYQKISSFGAPSSSISEATSGAYISSFSSSVGQGRSLSLMAMAHYSYKGIYSVTASLRRDGSTKFGDANKFGDFPGISARWNIIDEPFMESSRKWLSMFSIRPSWGITGNQPTAEYLYYSSYTSSSQYLDIPTMRPTGIRLSNLRWEKTAQFNLGFDLGFLDDKYTLDLNIYSKKTNDLLFKNQSMPSTSGYNTLSYQNGGSMRNVGYEFNFYAERLVKTKDFTFGFNFNLSNNYNTLLELKDEILASYNSDYDYTNGNYLSRVQLKKSYGSIYGFRYKGVYQYTNFSNNAQGTVPYAKDASGAFITDVSGNPVPMMFNYGSTNYQFTGGDAIYEDINHDGNINDLDIVYLGNSNPKLNGGFTLKFSYKRFSLNIFSYFRYGNKIVNTARMNAENMYTNNNQAATVNWRWRKDGDITSIPRALYKYGYNWLASDRYVEDGSFLRVKNITLNYSIPPKLLRQYYMNQISFYFTINNPVLFTKYSGVDPEVNYGTLGISTDGGQTPRSKSFTAGITVSF